MPTNDVARGRERFSHTVTWREFVCRGRGHLGRGGGCIVFAMTTPTFADVDEALARHDYRAALSILESLEVVGEDACYRRDVQAAACADRLGLYPLCEEYATRARAYGDDRPTPSRSLRAPGATKASSRTRRQRPRPACACTPNPPRLPAS